MSDRNEVTDKLMEELFHATVMDLLNRIKTGEATAQDRATAARLCKENGIGAVMEFEKPEKPIDLGLPDFDD